MNKVTKIVLLLVAFVFCAAIGIAAHSLALYFNLFMLKQFGIELP